MSSNIEITRVCRHCDKEFIAKTTVTKYCSLKCSQRAYKVRKREEKISASNAEVFNIQKSKIEILKAKEFLTVKEVAILLNCSVRSVYYYIEQGRIEATNLGQRITRIRRKAIDTLFDHTPISKENKPESTQYRISDCYTIFEAQKKYGVSESALNNILKRNKIPRLRDGRFVYIPKKNIDELFT